jgi:hypothetical protein
MKQPPLAAPAREGGMQRRLPPLPLATLPPSSLPILHRLPALPILPPLCYRAPLRRVAGGDESAEREKDANPAERAKVIFSQSRESEFGW